MIKLDARWRETSSDKILPMGLPILAIAVKKSKAKFRSSTGFEPMTFAIPVRCDKLSSHTLGAWSFVWVY